MNKNKGQNHEQDIRDLFDSIRSTHIDILDGFAELEQYKDELEEYGKYERLVVDPEANAALQKHINKSKGQLRLLEQIGRMAQNFDWPVV